jgi:hypothetical protein
MLERQRSCRDSMKNDDGDDDIDQERSDHFFLHMKVLACKIAQTDGEIQREHLEEKGPKNGHAFCSFLLCLPYAGRLPASDEDAQKATWGGTPYSLVTRGRVLSGVWVSQSLLAF